MHPINVNTPPQWAKSRFHSSLPTGSSRGPLTRRPVAGWVPEVAVGLSRAPIASNCPGLNLFGVRSVKFGSSLYIKASTSAGVRHERIGEFDRKYGIAGSVVRKSIAKVAAAGRSGDQARIAQERARHAHLMAGLP